MNLNTASQAMENCFLLFVRAHSRLTRPLRTFIRTNQESNRWEIYPCVRDQRLRIANI
jgi:hypothetical protein